MGEMKTERGYKELVINNSLLERIARHLIMHGSFVTDLGLYHGKMGIVLFFAHYAHYSGNSLYDTFAGELLDEIYEDIYKGLPVNFESGFCGIGWGIAYLLQNGFIDGDTDEILSDLDTRIMEFDLRRINDRSIRTGLEGISYYINKRINSPYLKSKRLPFDIDYLNEWRSIASSIFIPEDKVILDAIMSKLPERNDIISWDFGLDNGCAGVGLKNIYL